MVELEQRLRLEALRLAVQATSAGEATSVKLGVADVFLGWLDRPTEPTSEPLDEAMARIDQVAPDYAHWHGRWVRVDALRDAYVAWDAQTRTDRPSLVPGADSLWDVLSEVWEQ